MIFLSGVLTAGMLTLLALLPAALQGTGVWLGLGAVELALSLAVLPLPALARARRTETRLARPPLTRMVWLVWGVQVLVYTVQSGQWAVASLHGERQGLALSQIGMALAISSLVGYAGSMLSTLPVLRPHRTLVLLGALATMAASVVWFFGTLGLPHYFSSQLVLNLAFNGAIPMLNAMLTEHDTDGSLLSRSVVLAFTASALGTMGAGELLGSAGAVPFSLVAGLLLLLSMPMATLLTRPIRHPG